MTDEQINNPNGWPDPSRPGIPLHPEVEGWHVTEGRSAGNIGVTWWTGTEWGGGDFVRLLNTNPEWHRYVGAVMSEASINDVAANALDAAAWDVKNIDIEDGDGARIGAREILEEAQSVVSQAADRFRRGEG